MSPTPARVAAVDTQDVRFPASHELDGSGTAPGTRGPRPCPVVR
ncbi:hypothetical protein ACH4S8_01170 [Streptomyces sp. NPDC021080]